MSGRRIPAIAAVVGAAALLALIGVGLARSGGDAGGMPEIGRRAPDFQVVALDGRSVSLAGFRGRPVMLNFWTTWCGACRAEMPELERFYRKHSAGPDGIAVLAIDIQEDRDTVAGFIRSNGYTFPVALDAGAASEAYGVRYLPTSFFIDGDGVVRDRITGAASFQMMEAAAYRAGLARR